MRISSWIDSESAADVKNSDSRELRKYRSKGQVRKIMSCAWLIALVTLSSLGGQR